MAEPGVIDLKEATIYLVDGAGTPNELEVKLDEGNLTYTERHPREYRRNRGVLDTVRDGDQEPMEVSIDARFSKVVSYTNDDDVSIHEFLKGKTPGKSGVTLVSTGGNCEPFACDIVVKIDRTCAEGTNVDEIITFPDFRVEEIGGDLGAGQLSISGKCNAIEPTSERTTIV